MEPNRYTAFASFRRLAAGSLEEVIRAAKAAWDSDPTVPILVFDDRTGRQLEFDWSGTPDAVVARGLAGVDRRGPGRPKLGVDCGEICLLPRHWEWLAAQPRSASATIRRLIDGARKTESPEDRVRERVDAAATFMWALAGDLPGFEEASRSLYRHTWSEFRERISAWPPDVREHVEAMLGEVAQE